MALTSTIEYCTDRQVQDIYPSLSQHDLKRRLYNWVATGDSNEWYVYNTGLVTVLYADGKDLSGAEANEGAVDSTDDWFYDSSGDYIRYYSTTNPNSMIMEAGDDWVTIKERMRRKASRLIESRLDFRMAREIVKDREGNYPEIIIHATALQAVLLHLKSHDPNNEIIEPFQNDLNEIVEGLSGGRIVLPTAISVDSSKGVIREVSVNAASDLRPVELKGNYDGTGYELLKVIIDSVDDTIIGTATYSVYIKSSTTLKTTKIVSSKTINGDFQTLGAGSLEIRWGGDDVATALVKEDDEYEIELWGASLESSVPSAWSVDATRR
tara:strand:+ start:1471 stop:2442 length:972 start_codon:yes stop_codon:yes gene_type:complete